MKMPSNRMGGAHNTFKKVVLVVSYREENLLEIIIIHKMIIISQNYSLGFF